MEAFFVLWFERVLQVRAESLVLGNLAEAAISPQWAICRHVQQLVATLRASGFQNALGK